MPLYNVLFMEKIFSSLFVLSVVLSAPVALADSLVAPTIPDGMVSDQIEQQITEIYALVNKAPITCTTDCPSWEQTETDLKNAKSQTEHLLDTLDGQAKVMVPELTNLAINKSAFEGLVLEANGKSRTACPSTGALVYHFESLTYCFDRASDVDSLLTGLANYGQNKPSRTPTKAFLVTLNILTDLSNLSRQINTNLQSVTQAKVSCANNVLDLRCETNRLKQPRINTHESGTLLFQDVQDHWARQYIQTLFAKGVIKGRTATTFAPDLSVTRAELLKMVILATGRDVTLFADRDIGFSDVTKSHDLSVYITYARLQGWVNGQGGKFYPDRPVSSFEAIKIVFNGFGVSLGSAEHSTLPGVADGEQAKYIETARIRNLTTSPDMPQFKPNEPITRANIARIIASLLAD